MGNGVYIEDLTRESVAAVYELLGKVLKEMLEKHCPGVPVPEVEQLDGGRRFRFRSVNPDGSVQVGEPITIPGMGVLPGDYVAGARYYANDIVETEDGRMWSAIFDTTETPSPKSYHLMLSATICRPHFSATVIHEDARPSKTGPSASRFL